MFASFVSVNRYNVCHAYLNPNACSCKADITILSNIVDIETAVRVNEDVDGDYDDVLLSQNTLPLTNLGTT